MEREIVYKNLVALKEAVANHLELLPDSHDKNSLKVVSSKVWNEEKNKKLKEGAKFLISKTIAYCPSVIDEDMQMKNSIMSISTQLIKYLEERNMGQLAELMGDLITNEKRKDIFLMDYPSDRFGT
jgi:hypothetical protein